MTNQTTTVDLFIEYQNNIFLWIEDALGLMPQPPLPEYKEKFLQLYICSPEEFSDLAAELHIEHFEKFKKGMLTWQQCVLLIAVQRTIHKTLPHKIAVRSARGCGKSSISAIIMPYYLYCFPDSKVMATSAVASQLSDSLWSEAAMHLSKMNEPFKSAFNWQTEYIRMTEAPEHRWARARTASKETPEALSGVHAPYLAAICEEASAIAEEVWSNARATMTGENNLLLAISNPTRLQGTFYDAFNDNKDAWIRIHFNGLDSPIFDLGVEEDLRKQYGIDSAEYRASVLGEFPRAEAEFKEWMRLFDDKWIAKIFESNPSDPLTDKDLSYGRLCMGVDVSGEGKDESVGFIRSPFYGKIEFREQTSSSQSLSRRIHAAIDRHANLNPHDTMYDAFGIGHDLGQQVLVDSPARDYVIKGVNVGDIPENGGDKDRYVNVKAMLYDAVRIWGNRGGKLKYNSDLERELSTIYYRKNTKNKIEVMGKKEMNKQKMESPNIVEALILSFYRDASAIVNGLPVRSVHVRTSSYGYDAMDPYSMIPD
jgi:hypothetical protein